MNEIDTIPLPPWRPDESDLLTQYATVADNVIPAPVGYRPFANIGTTTRMSALTNRCQGAAGFIADSGAGIVVAGDDAKLYQNVDGTATDISKSGGYSCPADDMWEFVSFNNQVIATNISDPLQAATMVSLLSFADLATSTLKPQGRHIAVVRNRFVMIGNTSEGGVLYPDRVRWCAIDDSADWDADQATLADAQDIAGVGWIRKIVGGEYAVILCDEGLVRGDFVGTPDIFAFSQLEPGRGCVASGSVAVWGSLVFFLDDEGFFVFDGYRSVPIGTEKINRWFFDQWDESLSHRMSATVDKVNGLYILAFSSTASTGNPDYLLCYHIQVGEWSRVDLSVNSGNNTTVQVIFPALTVGTTLEGISTHPLGGTDLDAIAYSFDSRVWQGGAQNVGVFNAANTGYFFDGTNMQATVETDVIQHFKGKRSLVDHVRPLADGGTLSVGIAMRDRLVDSETFTSQVTQNANGICPFDASNSGRYAKYRLRVADGGTWTHLEGFVPAATELGQF